MNVEIPNNKPFNMLEKEHYFTWMNGKMKRPSTTEYMHITHEMLIPEIKPKLVAFCTTPDDVKRALEIARRFDLTFTCRSGGHSTAGFSNCDGIVIDVSGLNKACVYPDKKQMVVGAGAKAGEINLELDKYQLHVPGGGCSTVGIAGYMQGGGYGFTSREFGMNCDNVIGVRVMLADGKIVVADSSKNSDLFWAVRGGTGGNFGVLLDITYQLYSLPRVWGFALKWKLEDAPPALLELQNSYMKESASGKVNYLAVMASIEMPNPAKREPHLVMLGMYNGLPEEGKKAISSLLAIKGTQWIMSCENSYAKLNDDLLNILNPPMREKDVVLLPFKRCGYIEKPLNLDQWEDVASFFATTPNSFNMIVIEPYGGAINRFPVESSAFIHRNVYMDLYANSYHDKDGTITSEEEAQKWFDNFVGLMEPLYNGHRYQNYPTRNFPDYRWAYWGDAFNTLLFVKKKYDPGNFFHFEQSISDYPTYGAVTQSKTESLFTDMKIVYEDYSYDAEC